MESYNRDVAFSFSGKLTHVNFNDSKSASHGDIPMIPLNLPPPTIPEPPKEMEKQARALKKKCRYRDTIRKSARQGLNSIRRRYRDDKIFYVIYNITQKEALKFNEDRGLRLSEINWKVIRSLVHSWNARDYIWAVSTKGQEYNCVVQSQTFRNPRFGMMKQKMPRHIRERYHTGDYEYYYYEKLLNEPILPVERDFWMLTLNPFTHEVIEVN